METAIEIGVRKMGRTLVVGDIHGCADTLKDLILNHVKPREGDKFIFLGDYVDRSANIVKGVDFLIELSKNYECVFLMGNHEEMMLRETQGRGDIYSNQVYVANGGFETLRQYFRLYGVYGENHHHFHFTEHIPKDHQKFYNSLVLTHEDSKHFFVHAGVKPNNPLTNQFAHDILWIRDEFLYSKHDWGKTIIHGHTSMKPVDCDMYNTEYHPNKINLDTGCCYGHHLTCMCLEDRQIWRVKRHKSDDPFMNKAWMR